jgi:surface antigen
MPIGFRFAITGLLLAATAVRPAAADLKFVGAAPLAALAGEAAGRFEQMTESALTNEPDGKTLTWKNDEENVFGEVKLIRTDDMHRSLCRIVQIRVRTGEDDHQGVYRACRSDRKWRLVAQGVAARKP